MVFHNEITESVISRSGSDFMPRDLRLMISQIAQMMHDIKAIRSCDITAQTTVAVQTSQSRVACAAVRGPASGPLRAPAALSLSPLR